LQISVSGAGVGRLNNKTYSGFTNRCNCFCNPSPYSKRVCGMVRCALCWCHTTCSFRSCHSGILFPNNYKGGRAFWCVLVVGGDLGVDLAREEDCYRNHRCMVRICYSSKVHYGPRTKNRSRGYTFLVASRNTLQQVVV